MKELAERIYRIFNQTGLTQADFAASIEISERSLRAYLSDATKPSVEAVSNIAALYNVNCNWLLLGEGPVYRNKKEYEKTEVVEDTSAKTPQNEKKKMLDRIEQMQATINDLVITNNKLIQKVMES